MKYLYLVLLMLTTIVISGQTNDFLDTTFNNEGTAYFQPAGNRNEFYDLKVLNDGSIIMAGTVEPEAWNFDFVAIKVLPEGIIDNTFGDNGYALVNFETGDSDDRCRTVGILSNGKILLAGYLSSASHNTIIARLNADGSIDDTFGNNGKVIVEDGWPPIIGFITTNDIAILPNNSFYLAGTDYTGKILLNLFNDDGTLDTSFGDQGYALIDVNVGIDEEEVQIIMQTDGKIIIVGRVDNNNFAVRFNESGKVDSSYGENGVAWVSMQYSASSGELASAALQSTGKLIMAGTQETGSFFTHQMMSARLNIDGKIDSTYGNNGYSIIPSLGPVNASWKAGEAHSVLINENDHIFLGGKIKNGNWWRFGIMSFLPNGKIDTTFADNGFAYTSGSEKKITSMAWDGTKIVGAGGFYLARFLTEKTTAIKEVHSSEMKYLFSLKQNYPNPFNPSTIISFATPTRGIYKLTVYNLLGQKIKTLIDGEVSSGLHDVNFNATNLPSGTYFYSLIGENVHITKKMLLIR